MQKNISSSKILAILKEIEEVSNSNIGPYTKKTRLRALLKELPLGIKLFSDGVTPNVTAHVTKPKQFTQQMDSALDEYIKQIMGKK